MAENCNDTKNDQKFIWHPSKKTFIPRILPNLIFVSKNSKNYLKKEGNFKSNIWKTFFFQNLIFSLRMFEIEKFIRSTKIRIYHFSVWTEKKKKNIRSHEKKNGCTFLLPPSLESALSDRVYSSSPEQRCQCTSSGCTTCAVRRRRYEKSGRKENRAKADNVGPIRTNLSQQPDPCTVVTRCTGARAGSLSVLRCSPAIPSMKSRFRYQGNVPLIVFWFCGLSFLLFLTGSVDMHHGKKYMERNIFEIFKFNLEIRQNLLCI